MTKSLLLAVTGLVPCEFVPCSCGFGSEGDYFISQMHYLSTSVRNIVLIRHYTESGILLYFYHATNTFLN